MKKINIQKDKIIQTILSIVILIVPASASISLNYNHNFFRNIILLSCGLILLIIFLLHIDKNKYDKTDIVIFLFGFWAILSCFFSVHLNSSLWGSKDRYEGIFTIFTYILIYYNAKYYFKPSKLLENSAIAVYSAIFILAIIQFYFSKYMGNCALANRGACGTFGNVNFMGSFVSIILPLSSVLYLFRGNKKYLILSSLGFSVGLMCLTRSLWLAAFCSFLALLVYTIIKKDKTMWKRFTLFIIICFSLYCLINYSDTNNLVSKRVSQVETEIEEIQENGVKDSSGSNRIAIYKLCIKLLYKVPIFGCGVDALPYGIFVNLNDDFYVFLHKYRGMCDKAHCELLHIAVTMGIPALFFYMLFVGMIFMPVLEKWLKDKKSFVLALTIFTYLVQALFNISTIGVAPLFWLILGFTAGYSKESKMSANC